MFNRYKYRKEYSYQNFYLSDKSNLSCTTCFFNYGADEKENLNYNLLIYRL